MELLELIEDCWKAGHGFYLTRRNSTYCTIWIRRRNVQRTENIAFKEWFDSVPYSECNTLIRDCYGEISDFTPYNTLLSKVYCNNWPEEIVLYYNDDTLQNKLSPKHADDLSQDIAVLEQQLKMMKASLKRIKRNQQVWF
jgi:hypothetical protein